MSLKAIVQEKDLVLVSENASTNAPLTFRFASDNAIKLSYNDVASLFKQLTERKTVKVDDKLVEQPSILSLLNKRLKATEGVYIELTVKEFGAEKSASI